MAPISWTELRELAETKTEHGRALSFYLDLDPRTAPTWTDVRSRITSLLAAASASIEAEELPADARASLRDDLQRVDRFFERDFVRDSAAGIALFASNADGLWKQVSLPHPAADDVRVGTAPFVRPLVPFASSGDDGIVAVVNRRRGSLYRIVDGRIEELEDATDDDVPSRHDQGGWSQSRFQRHIDELAQRHFKDVAETIERAHGSLGRPPVVLVCTADTRTELEPELTPAVRDAVAGWTTVEAHASAAQVAAVALPVLADHRRREVAELLERWQEELGQGGRAACGWEDVFAAIAEARVETLLYARDTNRAAYACPACDHAQRADGACPVDGSALVRVADGLDLAVRRALAQGGTALELPDASPLAGADVCALLRW